MPGLATVSPMTNGSGEPLIRRSLNPHPNVWSHDFVHSLNSPYLDVFYQDRAEKLISEGRKMLQGIGETHSTPSAYDTAWVARVPVNEEDGKYNPQFPQALQWVLSNQLSDGSWGTSSPSLLTNSLLSTLSCVLALHQWNAGHAHLQRGLEFLKKGLEVLNNSGEGEHSMVTDFEIVFPTLLDEAESFGLSLPFHLPCIALLRKLRQERLSKVTRIESSRLEHSLEGIPELIQDWTKFINVQSAPASMACVLIHTKHSHCLDSLSDLLTKHGGWVPCFFNMDILERLLVVENLERLGLERHFQKEIKEAMDYVYRYWNGDKGLSWSSDNSFTDLETTALAFKLLRLHRYTVNPDVFKLFEDNNGGFACYGSAPQESDFNKHVKSMLNLYKSSELAFPDEPILDRAKEFATIKLKEALGRRETLNSWNSAHKLSKQIEYALKTPWHISAPRIEAKRYCLSYLPRSHEVGKSIFRVEMAYNEKLQELGKLDFNMVQAMHQKEMKKVSEWFKNSGLPLFTFARERPLEFYFLIAAGTYELGEEYEECRMEFTKVACLQTVLDDMYDTYATIEELKVFTEAVKRWDLAYAEENLPEEYMKVCYRIYYDIVEGVIQKCENAQGRELRSLFRKGWEEYLLGYWEEAEWLAQGYVPTFQEYMRNAVTSIGQRILLLSGLFLIGEKVSEAELEEVDVPGKRLMMEHNSIISRLADDTKTYKAEKERGEVASSVECYRRDHHPEVSEEDAVRYVCGVLEPAKKELTREYLRNDHTVPLAVKKMLFEETRVTMLIFKDGDGFGVSKLEVKDHITECLIHPLPLPY